MVCQKVSINGSNCTLLDGLRAPNSNNPVQDVTSSNMICGAPGYTSEDILDMAPGDTIGAWWEHIIGGPQGANDPDNPIAKSHKGPIMAYLASISKAATSSDVGLQWFKIWQDTF